MNNDRIDGTAEQAVGGVKEAAGKIPENTRLRSEDKVEEAGGTIQTRVGDVKETLKKSVDSRL
jgi:uncharacterized protein YjbJ (UPF0337 family)